MDEEAPVPRTVDWIEDVDMPRVFISHSKDDREFVEQEIVSILRSHGWDTWYSRDDIRASEQWERSIVQGLRTCDWFLVAMSPRSVQSRWVKDEVHWAMDNRVGHIVPVLIADCDLLDLHLGMPRIQYVDFRHPTEETSKQLLQAFEKVEQEAARTNTGHEPLVARCHLTLNPPRSHFHCGPWVPPEYFIGRREELSEARELIDSDQSFLIIGHPRAGKTSFCRKLMDEIADEPHCKTLLTYVNLQQCSQLTIETFLEHTILSIAGEIARQVFGCRYTDLKPRTAADVHPLLNKDIAFRSFVEIFHRLIEKTHKQRGVQPQQLITHEFVEFTKDLLQIAGDKGRNKCVVFYDEANRLPRDISVDLLLSIGEALGKTRLIGGYVADPDMADSFHRDQDLAPLFGNRLDLGPFRSFHEMKSLLARYYWGDESRVAEIPVSEAAFKSLWTTSRGEPFLIQLIADRAFRAACQQGSNIVEVEHIEKAQAALKMERPWAFRVQC